MRSVQCKGIAVITLLIALFSNQLYAQKQQDNKEQAIEKMVTARNYVFKAQTVLPTSPTANRQLTSDYDVRISPDTVITYLPYFGRAYNAPMDPTKGGIQFTSTKFDYTQTARKKGGWDIVIKPHDTQDTRLMSFSISESGYASLQVISNNRQPITFNGYITEKKTKR
ncbi:DUF4251 domain-containing protein [Chitinophaga filiformis]|uniref:DUF4251 domain-containing protein n=1 Tax=Chitinophaga filiformis TaxID=104663 RepID=A0A1G8D7P8_CHIFI|nr:DUF4251 domain-containing protein [Chitinophaga filiformis]SDH53798.1 protein of unknown function [Chitinophaga filiformis]